MNCNTYIYAISRALVGMMMYNPETNEIAKPSELLSSVKAIMSVLQSIENYGKNRNDPKFSDRLVGANSADPDQTAPRGAV